MIAALYVAGISLVFSVSAWLADRSDAALIRVKRLINEYVEGWTQNELPLA